MLGRRTRVIAVLTLLSTALAGRATAQAGHWNAVTDNFSQFNTGASVWSTGAAFTLGGVFHRSTVYGVNSTQCEADTSKPLACWGDGRVDASTNGVNQVYKNLSSTTVTYAGNGVHQPPDVLGLGLPRDTGYTIVRFTAPTTGTFNIAGKFQNLFDFAFGDNVYVLNNSGVLTPLFAGFVTVGGPALPFSLTAFLTSGSTLDFIVHDPSGFPGDVGLAADITVNGAPPPPVVTTPEPTALALLGAGLVGIARVVQRRRTVA